MANQSYGPIQSLRALAALMVVAHHAMLPAQGMNFGVKDFGGAGVDIFFVISGFIIYTSQAHRTDVRDFFLKRLARVAPMYWLFTAALIALHFALGISRDLVVSPTTVLQSLLFIPHFNGSNPTEVWPILVPGWSLNYEMFFYLLFGLAMMTGRITATLTSAIVILVVAGAILHPSSAVGRTYTSPLLLEFLAGVLIGAANRRWPMPAILALLAPAGLALLMFSSDLGIPRLLGWGGAGVLLVTAAISKEWRFALGERLGDASYTIYLSHILALPFLRAAWKALHLPVSPWIFAPIALAYSSAIGVALYYAIERPLTKWLSGKISPQSAVVHQDTVVPSV